MPRLNAFLLLVHLDSALRQGKTVLSKIFSAENVGPRNQPLWHTFAAVSEGLGWFLVGKVIEMHRISSSFIAFGVLQEAPKPCEEGLTHLASGWS